ncbi:MAG: LysM peptidoglycan-binding domain-containing protein, partial [Saprospiraceae bacterium]|nr:LysM peptidoglycan-binding domain-containing protein [Saprospiraceae bacterium]
TRISPQGVPATRVKTVAAPNGLVVEMLPEVRMESPAPAYNPVEPVASNQPSNNPLEVVIDTRTGQTQLYHTVQQGETLYSIARRYDRSADHIRKLNGISGKLLKTGQSLRIE